AHETVWRFVRRADRTVKKDPDRQRADAAEGGAAAGALAGASAPARSRPPDLHRQDLDQDQHDPASTMVGAQQFRLTTARPRMPRWRSRRRQKTGPPLGIERSPCAVATAETMPIIVTTNLTTAKRARNPKPSRTKRASVAATGKRP